MSNPQPLEEVSWGRGMGASGKREGEELIASDTVEG